LGRPWTSFFLYVRYRGVRAAPSALIMKLSASCCLPVHLLTTLRQVTTLLDLLRSLDRCPHGRHWGESCAGWRGPGAFDGGCLGGTSLGNPFLQSSADGRIGTDVHGYPITPNDITHAAEVEHSLAYAVRRADGKEYVVGYDETLARKAAAEDPDPFAHVIEVRRCGWTDSVLMWRLSDE
jgi:hypothetical protein